MKTNITHANLRMNIGIIGVLLPFILAAGVRFEIRPSISHFYYTSMGVVFTGVLWVFGLLLISYKGHNHSKISDNILTNLAGFLIVIASLVPTSCMDGECDAVNGHQDSTLNCIHLISAGVFFILMGWMSFFRFTRNKKEHRNRIKLYKFCGLMVWVSIAGMLLDIIFEVKLTEIDVFIWESLTLFFFGSSWLIKSNFLRKLGV